MWVPRHRVSSITLNKRKSRVRRRLQLPLVGRMLWPLQVLSQYSDQISAQEASTKLLKIVWGDLICLEIFFFKQKRVLSLGPIIKMSPKWGQVQRDPLPEGRAPGLGNPLTCGYPAGACGASWTSRLSHPKPVETVMQPKPRYFKCYLFTSQLPFTVSQFQPIWSPEHFLKNYLL